jgi:type I restriction enzyme S subunit
LTRRGVIRRDVSENYGKFPASFDTYQFVSPGDLVFCLFDIPETPRTVGLAREVGMVTGAYSVVASRDGASSEYLEYLYQGFDDEKSLSFAYSGLRNVIRTDAFMSMRCPLPPIDEQGEIVSFLDQAVGQIDKLVAMLGSQLELLVERRQSLITAAVIGELEIPGVAA